MTKEELLEPRFEVIADFPSSLYGIGDFVEFDETDGFHYTNCGEYQYASEKTMEKYPHLFKKLKWWEQRELNDMPTYILDKSAIPNLAIKVDKWTYEVLLEAESYILTAHSGNRKYTFNYPYLFPLTENEYNNLLKT